MSDSQWFIVGIIFSVVILAFTFSKTHSDESDFKWAVEFCGGKDKIKTLQPTVFLRLCVWMVDRLKFRKEIL